jgi:hypothetical protein
VYHSESVAFFAVHRLDFIARSSGRIIAKLTPRLPARNESMVSTLRGPQPAI